MRNKKILPLFAATVITASASLFNTGLQSQTLEEILNQALSEDSTPSEPGFLQTQNYSGDLEEAWDALPRNFKLPASFISKNISDLPGNEKIATNLRHLIDEANTKGFEDIESKAYELGVPYSDGSAALTFIANRESGVDGLVDTIERRGGEVVSIFGQHIYAQIPLEEIEGFANSKSLYWLSAQAQFYPADSGLSGEVVSEGVEMVMADRLHKQGITGKGIKIGVLDFGFMRYSALVRAGELPQATASRTFDRQGGLESTSLHGTACAEIIHDMAPDAQLYLAKIGRTAGSLIAGANWLIEQGVDIISFSGGGHYGPHDGNAQMDKMVKKAVRAGITWINAAGNEGNKHFLTPARDENRDGLIDVRFEGSNKNLIALGTLDNGPFEVLVNWDDWGNNPDLPASDQDIDVYLFYLNPDTRSPVVVAKSEQPQNGRSAPVEMVGLRNAPKGMVFYLALRAKSISRAFDIHVYKLRGNIQMLPLVSERSIGIPATSPLAVAVGAVNAQNSKLENYSSQGPTDDERLKPDVSAPANNVSVAYGRKRFPGTSAACPHVAGFAALLMQISPGLAPDELRGQLVKYTKPMGHSAPNNAYGHGLIQAKNVALGEIPDEGDTPPPPPPGDSDTEIEDILREILNSSG